MKQVDKDGPLVSVCCITYNHEEYIRDAIEGFLMQEVNFPIEIIIHDDASTDNTQEIIRKYAKEDARIIPLLREENIKSTGVPVFPITFEKARGKYIAMCEGDDYWMDSLKLQKQMEFMEQNEEYSLCFHNSKVIHEDEDEPNSLFRKSEENRVYNVEDIIDETWFIPTQSMMFRSKFLIEIPVWLNYLHGGDYALQLILAHQGNFYYLNEVMGVYRKHATGISKQLNLADNLKYLLEVLSYFDYYTDFKYKKIIDKKKIKIINKFFHKSKRQQPIWKKILDINFYLFMLERLRSKLIDLNKDT